MENVTNETVQSLYTDLGISNTHSSPALLQLASVSSRFLKDMKLNTNAVLGSANFNKKEAYLLAYSIAVNEKNDTLMAAFAAQAKANGATDEELAETCACTSLMSTNNIFYRFRHFMHTNQHYNSTPAGLRMSTMMNPVMGKELFELMSLMLSAVNGCEKCVTSHEHSVKEHGASEPRIYDAIRLGAVIKGLCTVI